MRPKKIAIAFELVEKEQQMATAAIPAPAEEIPKEYAAFKALLRQVVKPAPKPSSASPDPAAKR